MTTTVTPFSFGTLETLLFQSAKEYITKYFIPLTSGMHAVLKSNGKYELTDHANLIKTYMNRIDPKLSKYYLKEYTGLRTIVYELGKPVLYDDKLNLCQTFKHPINPYNKFSVNIKDVNIMLSYIKEVLCSDVEEQYIYVLRWLSNMCKGNKNDSILYLRGGQGIGKSTITQFLMNYVIGRPLSLETGAETLTSRFNIELAGKLMVVFEELEHLSTAEWKGMSTKLKRYSTSDTIMLESKGEKRYEAKNINNYFILSNHDCIKDDDGRRIYILDVSPKYKGDLEYFGNIRDKCFNDAVGEAFYCYLHGIDTTNFYAQRFPITQSKKDAYVKRLHSVELFLKDSYILLKLPVNNSLTVIFNEYKSYCESNGIRSVNKIDFNKKMSELGFKYFSSRVDGKTMNKYKISIDELNAVAEKGYWIHDTDEYDDEKVIDETGKNYEALYEESQDELAQMKMEVERLKKELAKKHLKPPNVKPKLEIELMDSDSDDSDASDDSDDSDDDCDDQSDDSDNDDQSDDDDYDDQSDDDDYDDQSDDDYDDEEEYANMASLLLGN